MSDDIVTRLRGCWCGDGFANRGLVDPECDHDGVRADAADEIERLRADRDRWRSLANHLIRDLEFRTDPTAANFIVRQMVARIDRERAVRGE